MIEVQQKWTHFLPVVHFAQYGHPERDLHQLQLLHRREKQLQKRYLLSVAEALHSYFFFVPVLLIAAPYG
ncbi:MAG: hypothetical protein MPJ22_13580, partial [Pirellulales bacterium]|nr:hypothetical protein [Pirellulales bacterium]